MIIFYLFDYLVDIYFLFLYFGFRYFAICRSICKISTDFFVLSKGST
jgi:hypothetical protein